MQIRFPFIARAKSMIPFTFECGYATDDLFSAEFEFGMGYIYKNKVRNHKWVG